TDHTLHQRGSARSVETRRCVRCREIATRSSPYPVPRDHRHIPAVRRLDQEPVARTVDDICGTGKTYLPDYLALAFEHCRPYGVRNALGLAKQERAIPQRSYASRELMVLRRPGFHRCDALPVLGRWRRIRQPLLTQTENVL